MEGIRSGGKDLELGSTHTWSRRCRQGFSNWINTNVRPFLELGFRISACMIWFSVWICEGSKWSQSIDATLWEESLWSVLRVTSFIHTWENWNNSFTWCARVPSWSTAVDWFPSHGMWHGRRRRRRMLLTMRPDSFLLKILEERTKKKPRQTINHWVRA